jgi:hypothetical protein
MAKIVKQVGRTVSGRKSHTNSLNQILHDLLIWNDSGNKNAIFSKIAASSIPIIHEFDSWGLSNYMYAYGLVEFVPYDVKGGLTLFDVVAHEAIPKLRHFNSQGLSNMLWAYAKVGASKSNSALFEAAGDSIVAMNEQALSNIAWAYATAGESHPGLNERLADHMVALKDLNVFKSQALANIVWAYATAGESHPRLFKRFANHIAALKDLNGFNSQECSNIIWACTTVGESHPRLFKKDLHGFNSQNLSNIKWSFATARESNPLLFKRVADHILSLRDLNGFNSQDLSNIAWAYATAGESHPLLFSKVERGRNPKVWGVQLSTSRQFTVGVCHHRTDGPTFVPVVRTSCEIKDERLRQPKSSKHRLGICGSQRRCSFAIQF